MTFAVSIGSYRLHRFVELGILRWRRLIPDVPIIVSDDLSPESKIIRAISDRHGCDYYCSPSRRGHFSADLQAAVNGMIFGKELGVDAVVKCSQRVIAVLPIIVESMTAALSDEECQVCLPGRINPKQISRRSAAWYAKFGILSDIVGFKTNAISPEEFIEIYRARCNGGHHPSFSFAETTWGWLLANRFQGKRHAILPEWTHHEQGKPKAFLRKSMSTATEYVQIARFEGIESTVADWPMEEWKTLDGRNYKPMASIV